MMKVALMLAVAAAVANAQGTISLSTGTRFYYQATAGAAISGVLYSDIANNNFRSDQEGYDVAGNYFNGTFFSLNGTGHYVFNGTCRTVDGGIQTSFTYGESAQVWIGTQKGMKYLSTFPLASGASTYAALIVATLADNTVAPTSYVNFTTSAPGGAPASSISLGYYNSTSTVPSGTFVLPTICSSKVAHKPSHAELSALAWIRRVL